MQLGRYKLEHVIGEGGFGQVWKGTISGEMGFEKTVAVKVLHPGLELDAGKHATLVHEALLGARLKHPNIVDVYEFTRVDDQFLMVMEFVDGQTLAECIANHPNGMPADEVREIVLQIAKALTHIHSLTDADGNSLGLIHRDLKPSNVMVTREGHVKICDFGISLSSLSERQTATGMLRGTPHFMSPEHVRAHDITPAADVWALGAVTYEMMTGSRLVQGTDPKAVFMLITAVVGAAAAAELESRDWQLSQVVGACLEQTPQYRPTTQDIVRQLLAGPQVPQGFVPPSRISSATIDLLAPGVDDPDVTRGDAVVAGTAAHSSPAPEWWLVPLGALTGVPVFLGVLVTLSAQPFHSFKMMGIWGYVLLALTVASTGNLVRLGRKVRQGNTLSPVAWLMGPLFLFLAARLGAGLGIERVDDLLAELPLAMQAGLSGHGLREALKVDLVGMVLGSLLCVLSSVELTMSYRGRIAQYPPTPVGNSSRIAVGGALVVVGGMGVWLLGWWADQHSAFAVPASAPVFVFLTLFLVSAAAGGLLYTGPEPEPEYRRQPTARLSVVLLAIQAVSGVSAASMTYREWTVFQEVAIASADNDFGLLGVHQFESLLNPYLLLVATLWPVLAASAMLVAFGGRQLWTSFHNDRPLWITLMVLLPWLVFGWAFVSKQQVASSIQPSFLAHAAYQHLGLWLVDADSADPQRGVRVVEGSAAAKGEGGQVNEVPEQWMRENGLTYSQISADPSGIQVGDLIVALNDRPIAGVQDITELLGGCDCSAASDSSACGLDACLNSGDLVSVALTRRLDSASGARAGASRMMERTLRYWMDGPPALQQVEPRAPRNAVQRLRALMQKRASPMLLGISPLEVLAASEEKGVTLTLALIEQLELLPRLRLMRMAAPPQVLSPGDWAQQLGVQSGVDSVLVGSVGTLGSEVFVNLERFSVEDGRVLGRSYRRSARGIDGLLPELPDMLAEVIEGTGEGASKEALMAAFRARSSVMKACYNDVLKDHPTFEAKVRISIEVMPTGRVKEFGVETVGAREPGKALELCLNEHARTWLFPVSMSGLVMSINMVFEK